jgi:hypothetical protein
MRALRAFGRFFWRFMVIFSFIVNVVLVVVVLLLVVFIFQIKNEVAQPLVSGLHSSFVGLDDATIDWTIPVRDEIPVVLDIPLQQNTTVTLTGPVPLSVNATIFRQGVDILGGPVTVNLQLPAGLDLPVELDLMVPVDQPLPVSLDVRAVIPLQETQLHDVAQNLRLQLEPLAFALHNLPNDFGEAAEMVGDVLEGNAPNLLAVEGCDYCQQPWSGYSRTAGLGYNYFDEPIPEANRPVTTGIVVDGGIPFLDAQVRPLLYEGDRTPQENNATAYQLMQQNDIPAYTFDGSVSAYRAAAIAADEGGNQQNSTTVEDAGIIGTPTPSQPAVGGPDMPTAPPVQVTPHPGTNTDDTEDLGILSP